MKNKSESPLIGDTIESIIIKVLFNDDMNRFEYNDVREAGNKIRELYANESKTVYIDTTEIRRLMEENERLIGERSAEEILRKHISEREPIITSTDYRIAAIDAMEEYASQFKASLPEATDHIDKMFSLTSKPKLESKEDSKAFGEQDRIHEYFEPDRGKHQENRYTFDQMMDFVKWYSGMDHSKVIAAYVLYIREVKPSPPKSE